jgi:hypothetical protein
MVERIYRRNSGTQTIDTESSSSVDDELDSRPIEQIIPNVKKCTQCKGDFNKGVEVVVINSVTGYRGTFCSYECRRKWADEQD